VRFDEALQKAGLDQALGRIGVRESLNRLVPRLTYYLLLFLFVRTAAQGLGLVAISDAMGTFLGYVPNLVAAILILVLGSVAAQFAGRTVARAAADSGIDFAGSLGSLVSGLMLFVLGIMALSQLKIDTEIVRLVTVCLLAGIGLAFGLSFGLGTRDITRNIVAGFYARKIFRVGQPLELRGQRGTLRSITPTQTILDGEHGILAVGNGVFLDEVVKQ
jgi:small-conductance mechanosensitive channel